MDIVEEIDVRCPYCGAAFTVEVDTTQADAVMIEDCSVCCRPVSLHLSCHPGHAEILAAERS